MPPMASTLLTYLSGPAHGIGDDMDDSTTTAEYRARLICAGMSWITLSELHLISFHPCSTGWAS